ncbi:MAG TPA: hypothetical protein VF701_22585 [Thermoanaerobaculia bacterium]
MIEMTPAAREQFENYLQRLRNELRGSRSVVADEVEQNVREHIDIALAHAQGPVGATEVIGVLDRLGPPERWLADEDQATTSRGFMDRFVSGPGDWLAYVSFAIFLLAAFFPAIGFFLLIPAMAVSRATVELAQDRGEPLGGRRWLVYPAIAVVLALTAALLILAPPLRIIAALGLDSGGVAEIFGVPENTPGHSRAVLGAGAMVFGSWWIIAAAFCAALLRPIRFVFAPLLEKLRRKHFVVMALFGALIAGGGATLIYFR